MLGGVAMATGRALQGLIPRVPVKKAVQQQASPVPQQPQTPTRSDPEPEPETDADDERRHREANQSIEEMREQEQAASEPMVTPRVQAKSSSKQSPKRTNASVVKFARPKMTASVPAMSTVQPTVRNLVRRRFEDFG